jgi:hypothetical protein
VWGGEQGVAGGKLDQFPLESENHRALTPRSHLGAEERLLIDPCSDQPERHFQYDLLGRMYARNNSKKGNSSIAVFKLEEPRLKKARQVRILEVVAVLRLLEMVEQPGPVDVEKSRLAIQIFASASFQFAGASRYVIKNPEKFGVRASAFNWAIRCTPQPLWR